MTSPGAFTAQWAVDPPCLDRRRWLGDELHLVRLNRPTVLERIDDRSNGEKIAAL